MAFIAAVLVSMVAASSTAVASAASASLTTNVTSFRNNDPVNLAVSNPETPTIRDVVALYFTGANVTAVKPLKVTPARPLRVFRVNLNISTLSSGWCRPAGLQAC